MPHYFYLLVLGILAYRVFRNDKKIYIKVLHAGVHTVALIFAAVGLKAVFDSHNLTDKPNLYSLHSWMGLFVVVAFGVQASDKLGVWPEQLVLDIFFSSVCMCVPFISIVCVCAHDLFL